MLESLSDTEAGGEGGFAGVVQAEFADSSTNTLSQYNLSAWRDEASAGAWSRGNAVHSDVVSKFKEGASPSQRTFSSVLMNLGPVSKGIRRHQRCLSCEQLNYNITPDLKQCTECGLPLDDQGGFDRRHLPWF